jgi:serine/threonine protein kinase
MIGTTIGQHRIVEELGHGGMGVVYKAEDSRLQRYVAIKFLREANSSESDAMKRFRQKARALSSLNHPNICTIHDIGEHDGQLFIVMELLEGATLDYHLGDAGLGLSELMAAGAPLPDMLNGGMFDHGQSKKPGRRLTIDEVLSVGIQVADALDAAHSAGVVHRDVKPANILVDHRLHTKLVDFGPAKLMPEARSNSLATMDQSGLTNEGTQLGTVAYMSPEQIDGWNVDVRTDIFSLGIVLYEISTRRHPFAGRTAASTIANILKDDPPPLDSSRLPVPPSLERIIRTCLNKNPDDRYPSAAALLADLQDARSGSSRYDTPLKHKSDRIVEAPALSGKIRLPREAARGLFILMQIGYLAMCLAILNYLDSAVAVIERMFGAPRAIGLSVAVALAMTGIAVRLYLLSAVSLDHSEIGTKFRQLFPFLLVLDVAWATSPILLFDRIENFALAGMVGLAYAPFSQRTLMHAAYP